MMMIDFDIKNIVFFFYKIYFFLFNNIGTSNNCLVIKSSNRQSVVFCPSLIMSNGDCGVD